MVAQFERASQKLLGSTVGQTDQDVTACFSGRTDNAENAKVAVAHKQATCRRTQDDMAGQDLLADPKRSYRAIQSGPTEGAEADQNPHQTPVGLMLVAMGREAFGDVSVRAEPHRAAIEQGHDHPLPQSGRTELTELAPLQAQGFGKTAPGQALAGVVIRDGAGGAQTNRESLTQGIRPAGQSVGHDGLEGMIVMEVLKEQIPDGDQRSEEPLVEVFGLQRGQLAELLQRKELEEKGQKLGRSERKCRATNRGWRGAS